MANLRDLATAAGVSIRTVNRVLKNNGYVHAATRRAVESAVARLGYRPNLAARALKTARSHFIAVLTFTEDEMRMAQVAALEQRLREDDYLVSMTFQFNLRYPGQVADILEEIVGQNPAGLVVLGHDLRVAETILPAILPRLVRSRLPYVLLDPKGFSDTWGRFDSVTIDRGSGVREAVHHLARSGRKRIAFLGTQEERTRLDSYEQAMAELGRKPMLLDYPGADHERLRAAARRFTARVARPDAVLAHSDGIALAFLAGLHDAGVHVPREVAVVGFDDRPAARQAWPALTTIAQPSRDVGRAGAEILLRKIAGDDRPPGGWSRSFPTRLIVRETA